MKHMQAAFVSCMPLTPSAGGAGVLARGVGRALLARGRRPRAALRVGAPNGDSRPQDRGIVHRSRVEIFPLLSTGVGPRAPMPSPKRAAQEYKERMRFFERIGPGRGPNREYAGDLCEGPAAMLLQTLRAHWLERAAASAKGKPVPPLDPGMERLFGRLVAEIRACDDAYYGDEPTQRIRDEEYDELLAHLVEMERVYPSLSKPDSPSKVVGHAAAAKAALPETEILGPVSTATIMSQRFPPYRHASKMLSLANAFTSGDVDNFVARVRKAEKEFDSQAAKSKTVNGTTELFSETGDLGSDASFCVEAKIDGVALNLSYRAGELVRAATRGDGVVGDDVTDNVRAALVDRGVPAHLPETVDVDVRGEVYISAADFESLDDSELSRLSNARNAAAGGLKNKDPKEAAKRLLRYVAYDCLKIPPELARDALDQSVRRPTGSARGDVRAFEVGDEEISAVKSFWPTQVETLQGLAAWGFGAITVYKMCHSASEIAEFAVEKERERASFPFEADGLVIKVNDSSIREKMGFTSKSPRGAIALKFAAVSAETVIDSVAFQVSRTGTVTPVANLKPVSLGGVTIQRATLHNFDEVARLEVAVGDTVLVARGGDVIPKIVQVVHRKDERSRKLVDVPKNCPSCGSVLSVSRMENGCTSVVCGNAVKCSGQSHGRILHFCRRDAMDISGLGIKTVGKLMDSGFVLKPSDLFVLTPDLLRDLPGFAQKSAVSLHSAIRDASTNRSLERVIIGLGIPGVGRSSACHVAAHVGSIRGLLDMAKSHSERFSELPNFAEKSAAAVTAYLQEPWVQAELEALDRLIIPKSLVDDPYYDETVRNGGEEGPKREGMNDVAVDFSGKTFAFTGTMNSMVRAAAMKEIRSLGGKVVSMVSRKTDFVVIGSNPGLKHQKALRLGVDILSEDDFNVMLEKALQQRNLVQVS